MFINACLLYILFEGVDKGLADEKKKNFVEKLLLMTETNDL